MIDWYIHFKTRGGHTNTHKVKADTLSAAVRLAAEEYAKLHMISFNDAKAAMFSAGRWDEGRDADN